MSPSTQPSIHPVYIKATPILWTEKSESKLHNKDKDIGDTKELSNIVGQLIPG